MVRDETEKQNQIMTTAAALFAKQEGSICPVIVYHSL